MGSPTTQAIENAVLRGAILNLLHQSPGEPMNTEIINTVLSRVYRDITTPQVAALFHYLKGKGYITLEELKHPAFPEVTTIRATITAQGINLIEGITADPGVVIP